MAALARLAELHQKRGKPAAVLSALEKLYSLDSQDPVVANRLGAAYVRTGRYHKAESHFQKLLNDSSDNAYAKAHLGYLLFREREYERALPLLMEGLRSDPSIQENGRFYLYTGETLSRLDRSDEVGRFLLFFNDLSLSLSLSLSLRLRFCTVRRCLAICSPRSTRGLSSMSLTSGPSRGGACKRLATSLTSDLSWITSPTSPGGTLIM